MEVEGGQERHRCSGRVLKEGFRKKPQKVWSFSDGKSDGTAKLIPYDFCHTVSFSEGDLVKDHTFFPFFSSEPFPKR